MLKYLSWIAPGGIILAAAAALVIGVGPERIPSGTAGGLPFFALFAALLLAGFYHRSRVAVLVLGLAALLQLFSTQAGGFTAFYFAGGLYGVVAGFLALLRDRGVFSPAGLAQLGVAALVGSFGALLVSLAPQDIAAFLSAMPLPPRATIWTGLPQPVFIAFSFSLSTTLGAAILRRGAVERGVFWHLLSVAFALYFAGNPGPVGVFFLAAGVTLGLSVMETSYAMAYRDELTGLPARRALMRDLEGMGRVYAAAMVDVDHFKRFNDRYGHDVGDQVLRMVAAKLAKTQGGGRAYRYGGEEFALLYPGKTRDEARRHLDQLCKSVEDATFTLRSWRRPRMSPLDPSAWRGAGARTSTRLSVTVSIGVADFTGGDPSPDAVLRKADQALYRAKMGGRNRVAR
jgi:diguanylate cyclase (GGDEF)-like protein